MIRTPSPLGPNDALTITPRLQSHREHLTRAAENLWRVQDAQERIIGHLRALWHPLGVRYRAERLNLATGTFRSIGEFWSPDDAVSALRY